MSEARRAKQSQLHRERKHAPEGSGAPAEPSGSTKGPFKIVPPALPDLAKALVRHAPPTWETSAHERKRLIDTALARLSDAGLACRRAPGEPLHIQGGTSRFVVGDVRGYERSFAIFEEPGGGFTAGVDGVRPFHDEEVVVTTLAQAVDAVLRIYRVRRMLSASAVDHR